MKPEITITLEKLQDLLDQQKALVTEKLLGQTGYYNADSDEGNYRTLNIDDDKFKKLSREANYPDDYNILKKYLN